jgi:hypothetical protein
VGLRLTPGIILVAACVAPCISSCTSLSKVAPAAIAPPSADVSQPIPSKAAIAEDVHRDPFPEWLRARLPPGGRIEERPGGALEVIHTAAAGETPLSLAKAYLDVTDVYRAKDLAAAIAKESPDLRPGTAVRIPHLLSQPFRDPDQDRMAWPAARALKGIYVTGETAGAAWGETLDRVQAHGLNAVVLDAKGSAGAITYPTRVRLALESGAGKGAPIPDLSRAIRFAHEHGVYVIARLTCFHDPWLAAYAPRIAVRSASGGRAAVGWIDPANVEAQDYLVDLVREVIDLGADEVQLDYVRFPVEGLGDAAMLPPDGHRSRAIASFVARVHEAAAARHVPLSLDVFGIAATASRSDVEALGQDLALLGPEAEAISPMVYPSHYPVGSLGIDQPADHPELAGFGTKAAVEKLAAGNAAQTTIVRPWLQASSFRTTRFGPKYIQEEIQSAEASGAVGWLMWSAGNKYWAVWSALPTTHVAHEETTSASR